jgi:DNA helicase HerA-like ATPase/ElaB/YqjD/DUF883 family membrane-anchored ribosome-binding protein
MMMNAPSRPQAQSSQSLALHVIPPMLSSQEEERVKITLEAAMQSLVLDKRHPVALELAGTAERRSFIVRATTQAALDNVEALLRSQYPQIEIRQLQVYEDPFRLASYEDVSAVELVSGTQPYLPLRTWQENKQEQDIDPLLALLAALSKLPEGVRAIAQIGLVPAKADWSRPHLRKSIEDALDPERRALQLDMAQARDATQATNWAVTKSPWESLSTPVIMIVGVLAGLVVLTRPIMPGWVWKALLTAMQGHDPHLSTGQIFLLVAGIVGILLGCLLLYTLLEQIRQRFFGTPIYDMRTVAQKTSRMAYRTRLRLYVIGPRARKDSAEEEAQPDRMLATRGRNDATFPVLWDKWRVEYEQGEVRQDVLLRLIAAYRQFHMASGAYFVPRKIAPSTARRLVSDTGWCQGISQSSHMITVDALAALWHMPDPLALPEIALVEHRRSRTLLMSPELAQMSAGLPPIGYSEHGGYRLPFALTPQFFTLHTLIGGKSGEGKSTFMEHIAREAMKEGGLVLIDPHGDLCEHVLQQVPPHRADDVVLIDLSDPTASAGINSLDVTLGRGRDKAISDLLKTFSRIWEEAWGPRMENAFEMALRTLFEANKVLVAQDAQQGPYQQFTILDVLPLLTNENFCHAILQNIQDDYLHRWWRDYYEPMTLMQQRDVVIPVLSKVAKFEGVISRRIVGQSVTTVNFTQAVAERKIILLKLAKGVVGADVAAIVGATLLGLIELTLEEQGSKREQERVRLPIIIDEFQTIAGADYAALAELRKYGATFYLATQSLEYLQKLDEVLLPLVLANVKQLVIFHMSAQDAETLSDELGVEIADIMNLDMYTCYMKLAAYTKRKSTFSLRVLPPPSGDPAQAEQAESIRARCRVRYTCPVDVIDERLSEAMIRNIRMAPAPLMKGKKKRTVPAAAPIAQPIISTAQFAAAQTGTNTAQPPVSTAQFATAPTSADTAQSGPVMQTGDAPAPVVPPPEQSDDVAPRRRRNRGRRGGRRSGKNKGATPLAFSDEAEESEEFTE